MNRIGEDELRKLSGARMDKAVARKRPYALWGLVVTLVAAVGSSTLLLHDGGRSAQLSQLRISTVQLDTFRDELAVRATVEPTRSVLLDVPDGGRVERVLVKDGAIVHKGQTLYLLSNPSLQVQMLARQADVSQQTANLANLRATLQISRAEHKRRLSELGFELEKSERDLARTEKLARDGFVSQSALEDAIKRKELQHKLLDEERAAMQEELQIKSEAIQRLDSLMNRLHAGLDIIGRSVDALEAKSPIDGKITNFALKEGAMLKPGDSVGRVDVPGDYKLVAAIDEYYLPRLRVGLKGSALIEGREFAVSIDQINPQVKDNRFMAELSFNVAQPGVLSAGQGIDVRLLFAEPRQAMVLEEGEFYKDTGGLWVFVVSDGQRFATKRMIKPGRRSAGRLEVLDGLKPGEHVITSSYENYGGVERVEIQR